MSRLHPDVVDAPDLVQYVVYAVILLAWAAAVTYSLRAHRRDTTEAIESQDVPRLSPHG